MTFLYVFETGIRFESPPPQTAAAVCLVLDRGRKLDETTRRTWHVQKIRMDFEGSVRMYGNVQVGDGSKRWLRAVCVSLLLALTLTLTLTHTHTHTPTHSHSHSHSHSTHSLTLRIFVSPPPHTHTPRPCPSISSLLLPLCGLEITPPLRVCVCVCVSFTLEQLVCVRAQASARCRNK